MDRDSGQESRSDTVRQKYGAIGCSIAIVLFLVIGFGKNPNLALTYGSIAIVTAGVFAGLLAKPSWRGATLFSLGGLTFTLFLVTATTGLPLLAPAILPFSLCLYMANRMERVPVFFTVLVACGVAWFSGAGGGPDPLRHWLEHTFHLSANDTESAVIAIRKTVHFSAYGAYGLSWRRYGWKMAVAQTVILASFDEARQTTAGNRTGSPLDVLLDLSGAIVLLAIAHAISKRPKRT